MADTYVLIQLKISGVSSAAAPVSGLNVNFIANDVQRQVFNQLGWIADQYGQPEGLSATSAVNDEASHGALVTITDQIVRSTQAS